MVESLQYFFENSSMTLRLVLVFSLVLLSPKLFQKFKLPGILAFILVGVLFGPDGFHLFKENGQTLIIFANLGKLLLLFFSGLDIELDVLKKNIHKAIRLAVVSFMLPAVGGFLLGILFDYNFLSSLMIAILFSSHSVIAYPILTKFGLQKLESVAVTVGATAITDIVSLILLAICLPIHMSGFSVGQFSLQIIFIIGFIPAIIFGFKWLGKSAFKHLREDQAEQVVFLLLVVGISAQAAEMVQVEPIVGAFLAGLAVSTTLPDTGLRAQIDLLGNTLFVPAFFISLGILIDPVIVIETIRYNFILVAAVILTVLVSKYIAAQWVGKKIGYAKHDRLLMASLTLPQVSSTLAVALVAYESVNAQGDRLIDEPMLNSILVLMVISSITGTILTEWVSKRMVVSAIKGPVSE